MKKNFIKAVLPLALMGAPALAASSIRSASRWRLKKAVVHSEESDKNKGQVKVGTESSSMENPFNIFATGGTGATDVVPLNRSYENTSKEPTNVLSFLAEEGLLQVSAEKKTITSGSTSVRKKFLGFYRCVSGATYNGKVLSSVTSSTTTNYNSSNSTTTTTTSFSISYSNGLVSVSKTKFDNAKVACGPAIKGISASVNGSVVDNEKGTPNQVSFDTNSITFTLTNTSGAAIRVDDIEITETTSPQQAASRSLGSWMREINWLALVGINNAHAVGASDFSVATTTPFTINNGSSETFTINFNPAAPGLRDGIVVVTFSDGSIFTFTISGNGTQALLNGTTQDIPVFSPFGLLLLLMSVFGLGKYLRRRK